MKVLQINIFGNLSTGKIAVDIARTLQKQGNECVVAYARNSLASDVRGIKVGNIFDVYCHGVLTRITDKVGFYSRRATKRLIKQIEEYRPDIIHLHNLHGYYINIEILFEYLKRYEIPVVWTLHDCWAFTGHCVHFENVACDKWRTGCCDCMQKYKYPASYFLDNSKWNFKNKKLLFTNMKNMTIVVPSKWLASLVKQSFLKEYDVKVIHNGIDLNVFKPTQGQWLEKNGLVAKKIILGVASTWTEAKGINDIIQLSQMLDDSYQIVLVGVSSKQKKQLPKNIVAIERTYNMKELVEIYSSAYVLINPTYEDNYPTVNLEAIACGTPVITYKTGGSPESVEKNTGIVIERGDIDGLHNAIISIATIDNECIKKAAKFNCNECFDSYIRLYEEIISNASRC